jgi:hypothetical protein
MALKVQPCGPRTVRDRQGSFFNHFAGQISKWNREPGRIGFMSTQERENRWQRKTCTERADKSRAPGDSISSLENTGRAIPCPSPIARFVFMLAYGGTAPLKSIFWSMWAWLATKFLRSDQPIRQLVQPLLKANRRGSPPSGAGRRAAFGTQASPRSSLPPIPFPSGFATLHLPLPQAPVGYRHWAERYDGKRDMYFLNAA